jgi:hypothetical protein
MRILRQRRPSRSAGSGLAPSCRRAPGARRRDGEAGVDARRAFLLGAPTPAAGIAPPEGDRVAAARAGGLVEHGHPAVRQHADLGEAALPSGRESGSRRAARAASRCGSCDSPGWRGGLGDRSVRHGDPGRSASRHGVPCHGAILRGRLRFTTRPTRPLPAHAAARGHEPQDEAERGQIQKVDPSPGLDSSPMRSPWCSMILSTTARARPPTLPAEDSPRDAGAAVPHPHHRYSSPA